jgi:drug/metabolite transporter (DMT)-like permease
MNVSVMNSLAPVLIPLIGAIAFRDRLSTVQTLGITASLAGALAIVTRLDSDIIAAFAFNWGDLIIVLNMVVFAIYSTYLRLRPQMHWLSFIFLMSIVSALATLPLHGWEYLSGFRFQPTWLTAATVLYVATLPSVVAFIFWNRGVELIGANRAGVFLHLVPLFSTLLATVLLGERLMPYHVVGFALILIGVRLASRRA